MTRKWLIGGGTAVVFVLGIGLAIVSGALPLRPGDPEKKPAPPLEFQPREVTRPRLASMPAHIQFSGPLVAPATAVVRARTGGTLLALHVAEGDRVRAGQALGQIDLATLNSRVAERGAHLASAQATLAQALRTHASNERLAAQQFISPLALDSSRAVVETAEAQRLAAQAALQTARVGLRDARLVAPIGGIVARRHVLPGETVSPEQPLLTIVDLQRLELAGSVGTHEVSRLAAGMPVQVRVEGLAAAVTGRIARIAPAAEPGSRAIAVTVELPNPGERLRAGQFAMAGAMLADDTERLTVPATAIGQSAGEDHVWVIDNGVLARRAVTLGRRDPDAGTVEVLQGLPPASTVLSARFENLREGAPARVLAGAEDPQALAAGAASAPALLK